MTTAAKLTPGAVLRLLRSPGFLMAAPWALPARGYLDKATAGIPRLACCRERRRVLQAEAEAYRLFMAAFAEQYGKEAARLAPVAEALGADAVAPVAAGMEGMVVRR